ncbi:MAG: iron-containing alcohol dehydrogenase [Proteobacteria bacterium]|nr:iron-containing alcohol dehydrogenase [Pseudomonadota bacterium]
MTAQPETLRGDWGIPTKIRFGAGRIVELPEVCKELGIERPLLVTDPGLAPLPMIKQALAANEAAGLGTGLFCELRPNPISRNVEDGARVFREGGYDGVIAWGGGSGLDVGKSIAYLAHQNLPIRDLYGLGDAYLKTDAERVAPIVAVPTTSGTGSEVGRATVVVDEERLEKKILFHPKMMPSVVIGDPELTLGLPARLTAGTGMDALAHNLEAYCVPDFHPMAEGIAAEGIRLIKESLATAVSDGANIVARSHMMVAAMAGATSFQKGLGAIHSMSHPVGARLDTHHGETNGVVMPYVLIFNRAVIEEKLVRLAAYIGLADVSAQGFIDWVVALRKEIGTPHTLAELGVTEAHVEQMARDGAVDPAGEGNPIALDKANLSGLFVKAIEGDLSPA